MNGFENIKDRVELREQFKEDTGGNWENSQGEVDVDYVLWLESKLFATPDVFGRSEEFYCKKGTCKEADQCNHCWNIENPHETVRQ